jgi:hypothetical protein
MNLKGMKNLFPLFLFLTVTFHSAIAQNHKIDSLKHNLNLTSKGQRFDILYWLGYEYMDINNALAYTYLQEAETFLSYVTDSLKIVKLYRIEGQLLNRLTRHREAGVVLTKVLSISQRNQFASEVKIILNSLAISYTEMAQFENALIYHFESLKLRELGGNAAEISISLNNIG